MFFTMQPSTLQMAQSCCRLGHTAGPRQFHGDGQSTLRVRRDLETVRVTVKFLQPRLGVRQTDTIAEGGKLAALESRSEERRVGKEGRSRWTPDHEEKKDAQEGWADTAPRERGEILRRAFELIVERQEELDLMMKQEMGTPAAECRSEVLYAQQVHRRL